MLHRFQDSARRCVTSGKPFMLPLLTFVAELVRSTSAGMQEGKVASLSCAQNQEGCCVVVKSAQNVPTTMPDGSIIEVEASYLQDGFPKSFCPSAISINYYYEVDDTREFWYTPHQDTTAGYVLFKDVLHYPTSKTPSQIAVCAVQYTNTDLPIAFQVNAAAHFPV